MSRYDQTRGAEAADGPPSLVPASAAEYRKNIAVWSLGLISLRDDRSPGNRFSYRIDLSQQLLTREILPCAQCCNIPAPEIEATVVTRRATFPAPKTGSPCRSVRGGIVRAVRRAVQTRSRRRALSR